MRKLAVAVVMVALGLIVLTGCGKKKQEEAVTETPEGQAMMKQGMMKGMELMQKGKQ